MDLTLFAAEVGGRDDGPVTVSGTSTRGGPVAGVRQVTAPRGIERIEADEMIVSCGAGTLVADLEDALREHGQGTSLPLSGTVGGALAVGLSGVRRLGDGPLRDVLLEAHYVNAAGEIVKAGGPTVKNVSGFDLCRLLVGSLGTLGFLGSVILRTRPLPAASQWFSTQNDPWTVFATLHRPVSVLWNGEWTWVLLEGHPADLEQQATAAGIEPAEGPPKLPDVARWSMTPANLRALVGSTGFVAEVGVGAVHHTQPAPPRVLPAPAVAIHQRMKALFDPTGRFNPGVDVTRL